MNILYKRFISFILALVLIVASFSFILPSAFADAPSETPVYVWIDCSNDDFITSSSFRVELSDIVAPNAYYKSIKIRQVDIPITSSNLGQNVTIDFLVSGAIVGNVGETHNTGYTFKGGHFSNYYTSGVNCNKNFVQNFSDYRQFLDYQFPQNSTTLKQYYFSQVSYHVIASIRIHDDANLLNNGIASIVCNNPPTLTFWENNTSNFIQAYWVFKGYSSLNVNYSQTLSLISGTLSSIYSKVYDISVYLNDMYQWDQRQTTAVEYIAQHLNDIVQPLNELSDIQQEHQDLSDQFLNSGGQVAIDDGAQALSDSNAFDVVDDVFTGFSSGPEFDSTQFESVWGNDSAIGWFSQRTQQNIHSPNTRNPLEGHEIVDFISRDIEEVYNAIEGDTNDQSTD